VAEVLRRFSGGALSPSLLRHSRHPLALVSAALSHELSAKLVDLTIPETLLRLGIRPDILALPASGRAQTQAVSRQIYESGAPGFRWWSALHGAWHSTVLFVDRVPLASIGFHDPELLTIDHPAVLEAAAYLYLRVR
jgi:hypothetical protein